MFSLSAALGAPIGADPGPELVVRWSRKAVAAGYRLDMADLAAAGAGRVVVDLGEDRLDGEVVAMAASARRAGLTAEIVTTAGAGWNREVARRLREVGLARTTVRLGPEPWPLRARRGWDPAGSVARTVEDALRGGLAAGVAFRLTCGSSRCLSSVLAWVEGSGASGCDIAHVIPDGRLDWRAQLARPAQTRYALHTLATAAWDWRRRCLTRQIRTWHGAADPIFLYIWCLRHAPEQAQAALAAVRAKAAAWPDLAWIDSQGNVFAVAGVTGLTLGNLRRRRFSDIWLNRGLPGWQRTRAFYAAAGSPCADCRWHALCRGGERGRAMAGASIDGPDPGCCLTARETSPAGRAG